MDLLLTVAVFFMLIGAGLLVQRSFPEWDPRDFPEYMRPDRGEFAR